MPNYTLQLRGRKATELRLRTSLERTVDKFLLVRRAQRIWVRVALVAATVAVDWLDFTKWPFHDLAPGWPPSRYGRKCQTRLYPTKLCYL